MRLGSNFFPTFEMTCCPWYVFYKGLPETKSDCLKSLMATYLFPKKVNDFTAMGVTFKEHLYVPEKNPVTGEFFHER